MRRTNISHFSHVMATVQRTGSIPGGDVRGLPNGRVINGLQGFHSFSMELAEAQKEFQLGRIQSALDRVKQLEVMFSTIVSRWYSSVDALIMDIRQGRQLKNLEKLKELKLARANMQQLISPARKAFQDLVTSLDHDAVLKNRGAGDAKVQSTSSQPKRWSTPRTFRVLNEEHTDSGGPPNPAPDDSVLGDFAANYRCGPRLQLMRDPNRKLQIYPKLEVGRFYYVAGLDRPRVVRVRELQTESIRVYDSLESQEATVTTGELSKLVVKGIWLLVYNDWSE